MNIGQVKPVTITDLWSGIESDVAGASTLEQGAQVLAQGIHDKFQESVVLARVFVTVDFDALPASNQAFVRELTKSGDTDLAGNVPVLSLVGTYGQESNWQDRRKSEGHVGIPLISSDFVGAIPMISRLLRELGVPMDGVDTRASDLIEKTIGQREGLFFVTDAGEATDAEGRKIIAAQDFVSEYGVKSVFGVGSAYPSNQLVVLVVFCRDAFARDAAENFLPLASLFKSATAPLIEGGAVFSG
ncbi:MAG: hypothetical protein P8Y95_09425 [Gammaproteobacteria bacterium]